MKRLLPGTDGSNKRSGIQVMVLVEGKQSGKIAKCVLANSKFGFPLNIDFVDNVVAEFALLTANS